MKVLFSTISETLSGLFGILQALSFLTSTNCVSDFDARILSLFGAIQRCSSPAQFSEALSEFSTKSSLSCHLGLHWRATLYSITQDLQAQRHPRNYEGSSIQT
jgi:hypothetical protein